jgi:hypothetical protein
MHRTYSVLTIDKQTVPAVTREAVGGNHLRVTAGTSCPQGGEAESWGRTVLSFEGDSDTDISFEASEKSKKVSLVFDGDTDCDALITALEFAADTLRTMQHANRASAARGVTARSVSESYLTAESGR